MIGHQTELVCCYGQPSRQLVALMELVEAINSVAASNIEVVVVVVAGIRLTVGACHFASALRDFK